MSMTRRTQVDSHPLNVLLVEDETLIRMTAHDMVSDLGHNVYEAGTATEALAILQENPIEVLITDIGLPGVSGTSLVSQVQQRWPAIRIVVASGLVAPGPSDQSNLGAQVTWLVKPYNSDDLKKILGCR